MIIDILTLFPRMFDGFLTESIIKRAIENKKVTINIYDFREYSKDPHGKVDDTPYGGGPGMVLCPQPIFDCIKSIRTDDSFVIMLTPEGKVYNQEMALNLKNKKHLILLCGHYEGFDERIKSICDMFISVGDFILTGGEIPSMLITDSIVRLLDGVIKTESHINDSFNNDLLDYPNYTHPEEYRGMKVPDVLLSGHHENINKYRHEKQIELTKKNRPDLLGGEDA